MAKSRTSGAGVDVRGLTFKGVPKSEKAKISNLKKVRAELKSGKTLVFRSPNGNTQTYKINSDKTYSFWSTRLGKQSLSQDLGSTSVGSLFLSKGGEYALK